jgi:hypothetical protein
MVTNTGAGASVVINEDPNTVRNAVIKAAINADINAAPK